MCCGAPACAPTIHAHDKDYKVFAKKLTAWLKGVNLIA